MCLLHVRDHALKHFEAGCFEALPDRSLLAPVGVFFYTPVDMFVVIGVTTDRLLKSRRLGCYLMKLWLVFNPGLFEWLLHWGSRTVFPAAGTTDVGVPSQWGGPLSAEWSSLC